MDKTEYKKKILTTFGILFIIGIVSMGANGMLELGYGQTNSTGNQNQTSTSIPTNNTITAPTMTTPIQTNSTTNQTSTFSSNTNTSSTTPTKEEVSNSIKGAITETGEFLDNATKEVTTSKSAGTILNGTSDALGNAYVETQKLFNPN